MSNFKDFTRAIAGIASALKGINTVVDDIPASGGIGGINYSTDEQDTGLKWIDGSAVYQKTLAGDSFPDQATGLAHGIVNLGDVISIDSIAEESSGTQVPLPAKLSEIYITDEKLFYVQQNTLTGNPYKITIRYTKTSE